MARHAHVVARFSFPLTWSQAEVATWLAVGRRVREAKADGKRIVFVSGVFDLLHEEHRNFLAKARQAGNYLVVGVESDTRVRHTKGPDRPHEPQAERVQHVLETGYVDEAAVLPEHFSDASEHTALIQLLQPHILAVSSHSPYQEAKRAIVEAAGGKLQVVHEHNPAVSTTLTLKKDRMEPYG